jgi:uncharacterized membrane protein
VLTYAATRWHKIAEGLWFVPTVLIVVLGGAAFALTSVDHAVAWDGVPVVFGADASGARTVLAAIAQSLITVAALVFSLTMVVLQLASSQFSPRVLPNFLSDRLTQVTVGFFVGLFVYCLVALRSVGGAGQFVPRLTVTVAATLAAVALILLVAFIHHMSTLIQVSRTAARIGRHTLARLDALYPERFGTASAEQAAPSGEASSPLRAECVGYVENVLLERLVDAAEEGARLDVQVAPGDFVTAATVLLTVAPPGALDEAQARRAFLVSEERDLAQDAHFGVRQLADVALRAISPSVNDPTTAVTCIGYLRAILEELAARDFPATDRRWEERGVAVHARRREFAEYLAPLEEIGRHADDQRVVHVLVSACESVAACARAAGADERAAAAAAAAGRIASGRP